LARVAGLEKFNDLSGMKFGSLLVVGRTENKCGRTMWQTKCVCGNSLVVRADSLSDGNTVSCGCVKTNRCRELGHRSAADLQGKRFGRWAVVNRDNSRVGALKAFWICHCDCGKEGRVDSFSLTSGNSKSCGCWAREEKKRRATNPNLTDEERALNQDRRFVPGLRDWRKAVYERDHYACIACGDFRGGNLIAHHKESWATNKNLRLDIRNGVTACKSCHDGFHKKYGYGGNTSAQWQEFTEEKKRLAMTAETIVNLDGRNTEAQWDEFVRRQKVAV
jgi:hypothetical protein